MGGVRRVFVGVDSGMNHLVRPALYGAYHEVVAATKADQPRELIADVVGSIRESGDVLAIMNAGAYGYSMSSNYNMRPRPAEVVVRGSEVRLSRRSETFDDLVSLFTW